MIENKTLISYQEEIRQIKEKIAEHKKDKSIPSHVLKNEITTYLKTLQDFYAWLAKQELNQEQIKLIQSMKPYADQLFECLDHRLNDLNSEI